MKNIDDSGNVDGHAFLLALGRNVKSWRTRRGLTQSELGSLTGVSGRQVGKIERGEYGQTVEAYALAQALGVPLSQLIKDAEEDLGGRGRRHA